MRIRGAVPPFSICLNRKTKLVLHFSKITITTLFSSPLMKYRTNKLIFESGEILLTRNTILHTDKEMPRMNQRRDGWKDPVTTKKNFQAIFNLAQL
jgi:hypothetical protein